jgi:hypothetical protein
MKKRAPTFRSPHWYYTLKPCQLLNWICYIPYYSKYISTTRDPHWLILPEHNGYYQVRWALRHSTVEASSIRLNMSVPWSFTSQVLEVFSQQQIPVMNCSGNIWEELYHLILYNDISSPNCTEENKYAHCSMLEPTWTQILCFTCQISISFIIEEKINTNSFQRWTERISRFGHKWTFVLR